MKLWKENLEKSQQEKAGQEIKDLRLKIKEEQAVEYKQLQEELQRQKQEALE